MLNLDKSKFLKNVTDSEQHIVEASDVKLDKLKADVEAAVMANINSTVGAIVDRYIKDPAGGQVMIRTLLDNAWNVTYKPGILKDITTAVAALEKSITYTIGILSDRISKLEIRVNALEIAVSTLKSEFTTLSVREATDVHKNGTDINRLTSEVHTLSTDFNSFITTVTTNFQGVYEKEQKIQDYIQGPYTDYVVDQLVPKFFTKHFLIEENYNKYTVKAAYPHKYLLGVTFSSDDIGDTLFSFLPKVDLQSVDAVRFIDNGSFGFLKTDRGAMGKVAAYSAKIDFVGTSSAPKQVNLYMAIPRTEYNNLSDVNYVRMDEWGLSFFSRDISSLDPASLNVSDYYLKFDIYEGDVSTTLVGTMVFTPQAVGLGTIQNLSGGYYAGNFVGKIEQGKKYKIMLNVNVPIRATQFLHIATDESYKLNLNNNKLSVYTPVPITYLP